MEQEADEGRVVVMSNGWLGEGTGGMPQILRWPMRGFPERTDSVRRWSGAGEDKGAGVEVGGTVAQYGKFDLWNSASLRGSGREFEQVWEKTQFELLRRR